MEIKKTCEIYLDSFRTEVNTRFENIESELDKIKQDKGKHPAQDSALVVDPNTSVDLTLGDLERKKSR